MAVLSGSFVSIVCKGEGISSTGRKDSYQIAVVVKTAFPAQKNHFPMLAAGMATFESAQGRGARSKVVQDREEVDQAGWEDLRTRMQLPSGSPGRMF